MKFTQAVCSEVFPESDVRPDSEPEFCIARGLSRLGRWEGRSDTFKAKVDEFCNSGEIDKTIKQRIPQLVESLGRALSEGLIAGAVKPSLSGWRDGRIKTLAQMETRTQALAKEWLAGENAREAIRTRCAEWLNFIQAELSRPIGDLCQQYQLPASALALDVAPDISGISTGKFPTIGDPVHLDEMTQMIVAVVIASILGGGGMALLMHGPVGWIIGLAIGLAIVFVGQDAANEAIKQVDIPGLARGLILSDAKIDSKCKELTAELGKTLSKELDANDKLLRDLAEKIRDQVHASLRDRAEEAVILIK